MCDKGQAALVHRNQAGKRVAAHDLGCHLDIFGVKLGGQVHRTPSKGLGDNKGLKSGPGARLFPFNTNARKNLNKIKYLRNQKNYV